MEKQRIDRIMEMIKSNESLQEQYKKDPDTTISMVKEWLDAVDQGKELDPYFSQREALTFTIQQLEHDLKAYQERGQIAEAALTVDEIILKKKRLALVGREAECPEELTEIRAMEQALEESKQGLHDYKTQGLENPTHTL